MIIPVALEELKSKPKFPLFFVGDGKKNRKPANRHGYMFSKGALLLEYQ